MSASGSESRKVASTHAATPTPTAHPSDRTAGSDVKASDPKPMIVEAADSSTADVLHSRRRNAEVRS